MASATVNVGRTLRRTALIALLAAVFSGGLVLSVPAQQPQVGDIGQVVSELERYRQEVAAASAKAQAKVDRLVSVADGSVAALALLRDALGGSPLATDPQAGLFGGQLREIDKWISLTRNHGSVDMAFREQTRQAMELWRNGLPAFQQALAVLESELNAVRSSSVPQVCVGSETAFCNEAREKERERRATAELAASDVRRRLRADPVSATLDGPAPQPTICSDTNPVALKIVVGRHSSPVNEHIQVDIATVSVSHRGAVVAQDEEIVVETIQDGETTTTRVQISRGSCVSRTKVSPTKPRDMQIRAKTETRRLKPAQQPAAGCGTAPLASMDLSMDTKGHGDADGVTPIAFSYKFFDKGNQLSTGGRKKDLVIHHQGVGIRTSVGKSAATDSVPADQCVSSQELRSADVGDAAIKASSGSLTARPAEFTFAFPLTIELGVCVIGLALLITAIFVSLPSGPGRSPRRERFAKHFLAGLIVAGVVYVCLLMFMRRPAPAMAWFLLICLGSVLGALLGVWILKAIVEKLPRLGQRPDK